jgi:hypothetical protein
MNRPMPPSELGRFDSYPLNIMPAHELNLWVKQTFLDPDSALFNQDHYHLDDFVENSTIGFLWAAGSFKKQMKSVIGTTEQVAFRVSGYQRMRQEQQLMEWFGYILPEYIITLDGYYCAHCSDSEFCALVEHELYHIGHAKDEWGDPKFNMKTGLPVLAMRDHDVSEFIGVVERYGVGDKEGTLARLVAAANSKPTIKRTDLAHACGTCLRLVA